MDLPHINPIGLREVAEDFEETPRQWSRPMRIITTALFGIFAFVTIITTAASLGAYCLTSDGADTRSLPANLRPQP